MGFSQARMLEWIAISFTTESPDPEIETRPPALQADSLPPEPQGKPPDLKVRIIQEREVVYTDLTNSYNTLGNMIYS